MNELCDNSVSNEKHDNFHHHVGKIEHFYRKILHTLELAIAGVTIVALVAVLIYTVVQAFYAPTIFEDTNHFLHSVLTVVVGLEFVRMLVDLTPANTIEVLIVAIARQVIISHDNPLSNLACVVCIAGLFATRHFLIPKNELKVEMSEVEDDEEPAEIK